MTIYLYALCSPLGDTNNYVSVSGCIAELFIYQTHIYIWFKIGSNVDDGNSDLILDMNIKEEEEKKCYCHYLILFFWGGGSN